MSRIQDNLYLGSYEDAKNRRLLHSQKITHIVTVGIELKTIYPESFKYLYIPAYDSPDYKLIVYFDEIADFIHNAIEREKGKVFVHCYWGVSRSTTAILAYFIKHHNMSPLEAKIHVRQRRSIIYPNEGFLQQLEIYSKKINQSKIEKQTKEKPLTWEMETRKVYYCTANHPWPNQEKFEDWKLKLTINEQLNDSLNRNPSLKKYQSLFLKTSSGFFRDKDTNFLLDESLQSKKTFDQEMQELIQKKRKVLTRNESNQNKFGHKDYSCRDCGFILFHSLDIIHNAERNFRGRCNAIYLRPKPWIKYSDNNISKIYCPNSDCKLNLGYINQNGGACSCGKHIDKMFVIFPLRIL